MTSLVNKYFKKGVKSEQNLFDSLKTESIQIAGNTYYYLPRKIQRMDLVLGEDILSKFDAAVPIEGYLSNVNGFDGQKEIFSKFGLQIQSSYELVFSQSRWEKELKTQSEFMLVGNRPQEGDLIYDPMTDFLMEIKFVDHDAEFYQVGKNYLYHLTCEAFLFNNEEFATGVADIDDISEQLSRNLLDNELLDENGDALLNSDCDSILQDVEPVNNEYGTNYDKADSFKAEGDDIEWSAENPFG